MEVGRSHRPLAPKRRSRRSSLCSRSSSRTRRSSPSATGAVCWHISWVATPRSATSARRCGGGSPPRRRCAFAAVRDDDHACPRLPSAARG
eukprot:4209149-Lingulodinium_polyedra.AAC.1